MGIVYRIYGGMSFYQRKEVKDYIAYLRLVVNPRDEEALKRVINYPVRGIGKTTIDKAVLFANESNLSLWDIISNAAMYGFKGGTLECIDVFVTMVKMFQSEMPKRNAYDLAVTVGKSTNIVKELFNDKTTEGLARYENVQELLNSIKEFTETPMSFEDGEVEWKTLGDLAENLDSMRKPITSGLRDRGDIPYYGASGIVDYVKGYIFDGDLLLVSEDGANLLARSTPIAFSISGKSWVNNHAHVLKFETYAERRYVEFYLNSIDLTPYISGAAQPKLNQKNLNSISIPNPSPEEKERIVAILDKFDALTNSITEGLPREIELRRKQYEHYRDLLLSFPKPKGAEA
jgi:hypothetical protein